MILRAGCPLVVPLTELDDPRADGRAARARRCSSQTMLPADKTLADKARAPI